MFTGEWVSLTLVVKCVILTLGHPRSDEIGHIQGGMAVDLTLSPFLPMLTGQMTDHRWHTHHFLCPAKQLVTWGPGMLLLAKAPWISEFIHWQNEPGGSIWVIASRQSGAPLALLGSPPAGSPPGTRLLRVLQNAHLGWSPGVAFVCKCPQECVHLLCCSRWEWESSSPLPFQPCTFC